LVQATFAKEGGRPMNELIPILAVLIAIVGPAVFHVWQLPAGTAKRNRPYGKKDNAYF